MKESEADDLVRRTENGEVTRTWSRPKSDGKAATAPEPSKAPPTTSDTERRNTGAVDRVTKRLVDAGMSADQARRKAGEVARETDAKNRR